MPFFGSKTKTPHELASALRDSLNQLNNCKEKDHKKVSEEVSKNLQAIKIMLYGTSEQEPIAEQVNFLSSEILSNSLFYQMLINLPKIDFEGRKDVGTIVNNVLRRQIGERCPAEEYLISKMECVFFLIKGYENQEIALNCGMIARECFRSETVVKNVLESRDFYQFFKYVEVSTFDIASDAFSTFKELLTKHKQISAEFLESNYEKFFSHYQLLLDSENYVTRRQALKLLGELLLDRHNFTVMNKYISSADNLKLIMNLLREKSRNIQFEAFHVFKIFVANPNKTKQVQDILVRNKEKLVDFLSKFHSDRTEDEQFNDEKTYLVKQIMELKPTEEEGNTH